MCQKALSSAEKYQFLSSDLLDGCVPSSSVCGGTLASISAPKEPVRSRPPASTVLVAGGGADEVVLGFLDGGVATTTCLRFGAATVCSGGAVARDVARLGFGAVAGDVGRLGFGAAAGESTIG